MAKTRLISPGSIPNHRLLKNLQLNDQYISNDGGDEGIHITDAGLVKFAPQGVSTHEIDYNYWKLTSAASPNGHFKLNMDNGDGKTSITTTDPSGSDADLIIQPDGDIGLYAGATNKIFVSNVTKTASSTNDASFHVDETLNLGSGADGSDVHYGIKYTQTQTDLTGWDDVYLMYLNGGTNKVLSVDNNGLITLPGTITVKEQAAAPNHVDTYGKLWVHNSDPTALYFTNDDGDDIPITTGDHVSSGTISLPANQITAGSAAVSLATTSGDVVIDAPAAGDIIFKRAGGTEFLTFNTSDIADVGNVPVTEIMGKDDQRLRIRCRGDNEDLQLFSERNVEIAIANISAGEGGGVQMWKDLTPTLAEKNLEDEWVADQDDFDFDLLQVADQDNTSIPAQIRGSTSGTRCILKYSTDGSGVPTIGGGILEPGHGYTNAFTDATCDYNADTGLNADGSSGDSNVEDRSTICHNAQTIAKVVFMSVEGVGIPAGAYIGEVVSSTCFRIHLDGGTGAIDNTDREAVTATETNETLTFRDRVCFQDAHDVSGSKHCVLEVEEAGQGSIIIGQSNAAAQTGGKLQNVRGMFQFDSNIVSTGMSIRAVNGDLFLQSRSGITTFGEENRNRLKMDSNDNERRLFIAAKDVPNLNCGQTASWTGAGGLEIAVVKTSGHTTIETHGTTAADMEFVSAGTIKFTAKSDSTAKVEIEKTTSGDDAQDALGLHIDFDRTVASSGTAAHNDIGINLDVNSASLGTSTVVGMDMDVVGATSGTHTATGLDIKCTGADNNYGMNITVPDVAGDYHIKLMAADDVNDYSTLHVADTGDMIIATVGSGTTDSDLTLDVDGDINLDADGGDIVFKDNGTTLATIDMDGTANTADIVTALGKALRLSGTTRLEFNSAAGKFTALNGGTQFSVADSAFAGMILGYTTVGIDATSAYYTLTDAMTCLDDAMKVKFVGPPSGVVEIFASIYFDTARRFPVLGLSDQDESTGYQAISFPNATDVTNEHLVAAPPSSLGDHMLNKYWVVTGLTPGTVYEWWFAAKTSLSTGGVLRWGGTATSQYPPFIMKATALPTAVTDYAEYG